MAVMDATAAIDPSTGAPMEDPNQKKAQNLLTQLGVHPAQLQAQKHLTGLMSGLSSLQGVQNPAAQGQSSPPDGGNVGPQLVPPAKPPAMTSGAQPQAPTAAAAPPPTPADNAPVTMPGPSRVTTPQIQNTEADIDRAQHEHDRLIKTGSGISQIHNPFLRGLAHAGEFAETLLVPSAAALTPGTELHHDILVKGAQNNVDKGLAQEQEEEKIPSAEATTSLENARVKAYPGTQEALDAKNESIAAKNNAAANNMLNPTAKTQFQLWAQQNPGKAVEDYMKEIAEGKQKENDYEQYFTAGVKEGKYQNTSQGRLKAAHEWAVAKQPPQRPPQALVIAPNPTTGDSTASVVRPGTVVPDDAQTVAGFNKTNTPTNQQITSGGRGKTAEQQLPALQTKIDQMKDQIGPMSGRWGEFMQGKVGAPNADMASLRTDLLLMSSAVALMHAQGRLPENLRQEFDHAINAPQQSAENLQAVLKEIQKTVELNVQAGQSPAQRARDRIRQGRNPQQPTQTPPPTGNNAGKSITIDHAQQIADQKKIPLQAVLDDAKLHGIQVK